MAFNFLSGSVVADSLVMSGSIVPADPDLAALGSAAAEWSDIFLADAGVINLGLDQDVTLTHVADAGLLLNSSRQLQFGDSATYIRQKEDGELNLVADGKVSVTGKIDVSGDILGGGKLELGSASITEAELEMIDSVTGGTVTASKFVAVDANKDVSGLRNVTATGAFIIGSANLNEADMELIDGLTAGTIAASKAATVDSNKDASGFRNVTADGTIVAYTALSGSKLVVGGADMSEADLEQLDGITAGTVAASKAVVVDSNKDASGFRNISATQLTTSGRVIVDDATEATSTTDGSLQTDGGLSVAKSAVIGDDLDLLSDAAILSFGAGKDVTFTHDNGTGMDVAAAGAFDITAGAASTWRTSAGDLTVKSAADIVMQAQNGDVMFADGTTNFLKLAADSNDAVFQIQQDAKNFIFKQYDGNDVVKMKDNGDVDISSHNGSSKGLSLGGTVVTATAAELNLVDGSAANTVVNSKAVIYGSAGEVKASSLTTTGNASVSGSMHILGDLDVAGAINSVTKTVSILEVEDLNILCASGSNASAADGGGLLIGGYAKANSAASLTWDNDSSVIELGIAGSNEAVMSATAFSPATSDGMALGTTGLMWSDAFLASGGVINFNNGDVTMTHSANLLAIAGGNTRVDRLEIDSANDYIDVSTDLTVVAAADIKLKPSGNDVVVDGAHVKPVDDGTYDLGADGTAWRTLYVDSLCPAYVAKTSDYTISATADFFVGVNTSGGAVSITLPAASAAVKGKMYVIKDIGGKAGDDGKNITIVRNGSDTMDGIGANRVLNSNHAAINLMSDGSNWFLW